MAWEYVYVSLVPFFGEHVSGSGPIDITLRLSIDRLDASVNGMIKFTSGLGETMYCFLSAYLHVPLSSHCLPLLPPFSMLVAALFSFPFLFMSLLGFCFFRLSLPFLLFPPMPFSMPIAPLSSFPFLFMSPSISSVSLVSLCLS